MNIIDTINSYSTTLDDFNIKDVKGNLVSSFDIEGISFSIDNNYVNIRKYNFKSDLVNYINSIKDFFSIGAPSFFNLAQKAQHKISNISIENKKTTSALVIPNLEIDNYSLSLDTLFSSYNKYTIFAYNLKSELLDLDVIDPFLSIKRFEIDTLYAFKDDNEIKMEELVINRLEELSIAASNIIINSNILSTPLLDELVLSNAFISIDFIDRTMNLEIQNSTLVSPYYKEILIDNLTFYADEEDSSGSLNLKSFKVSLNNTEEILLNNLSLDLKGQSDIHNYIISINGLNNYVGEKAEITLQK